jgi:hypothetical protein
MQRDPLGQLPEVGRGIALPDEDQVCHGKAMHHLGDPTDNGGVHNDDDGSTVLQRSAQPAAALVGVDRDPHSAEAVDGEHQRDQVGAIPRVDRHRVPRGDAQVGQAPGQAIGSLVHIGERPAHAVGNDKPCLGTMERLLSQDVPQGPLRGLIEPRAAGHGHDRRLTDRRPRWKRRCRCRGRGRGEACWRTSPRRRRGCRSP